jgi:hypothetical protein
MRLLLLLSLLLAAAPAFAQTTPLDWTDGGEIQLPAVDLDGDAYPSSTVVSCRVSFQGFSSSADILVAGAPGSLVPISRPSVPKVTSASSTTTATGRCATPLNLVEAGAPDANTVSLRPWRGSGSPSLRP